MRENSKEKKNDLRVLKKKIKEKWKNKKPDWKKNGKEKEKKSTEELI